MIKSISGLSRNDHVIIFGDFGGVWDGSKAEGVVRVELSATDLYGGNDFCVYTVCVVIFSGRIRVYHIGESDNQDAE